MSSSASSSMRRPLRTTGWSSASTIVIVPASTDGTLSLMGVGSAPRPAFTSVPIRDADAGNCGGMVRQSAAETGGAADAAGPARRTCPDMSIEEKGGQSLMNDTGLGLLPGLALATGLLVVAMAAVLTGSKWAVVGVLVIIGICVAAVVLVVLAVTAEGERTPSPSDGARTQRAGLDQALSRAAHRGSPARGLGHEAIRAREHDRRAVSASRASSQVLRASVPDPKRVHDPQPVHGEGPAVQPPPDLTPIQRRT